MEEEIELDFVNKGKKFKLPKMTVDQHEEWLEEIAQLEKEAKDRNKDYNKEKFDRLATKMLVLKKLQEIDKNVTLKDVGGMHPNDFIWLSNKIWETGRILGVKKEDFQIS